MSTRYSPVRHSTWGRSPVRVRLACVKHAASVQSEPESNSPVQILYKILTLAGENRNLKDFLPTRYSLVNEPPGLPAPPDLFGRREECLCSPSLPESTVFFASGKISFCLCFKNRPSSRNRNVAGRPPFVNTLRPKSFTFVAKDRLKRLSLPDLFFYPLLVVKRAACPRRYSKINLENLRPPVHSARRTRRAGSPARSAVPSLSAPERTRLQKNAVSAAFGRARSTAGLCPPTPRVVIREAAWNSVFFQ